MSEQLPDVETVVTERVADRSITVLHVDDEPAFTELCAELLESEDDQLTIETATGAAAGLEYLERETPDCIVSDYDMPEMDGLEFFEVVRETHPSLPFILFTGKGSEEIASEAISAGVTDYLQKSRGQEQYRILRNRIRNGVENYRSQRNLQMFRAAVEHSGHSIYITDTDGVIEYVNPSFTETTGYTPEEAIGRTPKILKSGMHESAFYADLWETISGGDRWEREIVNERKSGDLYVVEQTIAPISLRGDDPEKFVAVNREITDRKRYQLALERQCDTLGALNRMLRYRLRDDLQVMTGYAELLEAHVEDGDEEQTYLKPLQDRSWAVFDRIEAVRTITDTLRQTEPDGPIELREVIERATRDIESVADAVSVSVETDLPTGPVAVEATVEPVFSILLEHLASGETRPASPIRIAATERDDRLLIRLSECEVLEFEDDSRPPSDMPQIDDSASTAELYIVQGLIEGIGGTLRTGRNGRGGVGFEIEFPRAGLYAGNDIRRAQF